MKATVIGCGRMGARPQKSVYGSFANGWLPLSHIEAIQEVEGLELVAACDVDEKSLRFVKETYSVNNVYQDYRELIDIEKPDIISIATRTPIKKDIIEYACKNGVKGIYVEKPLANSLQCTQEILLLVQQAGCKLLYGVNRRYHQAYNAAKEMITNGLIGDLVNVTVDMGASQLLWTHPHSVDLIMFFANTTDLVSVQSQLVSDSTLVDVNGNIDSDPIVEFAHFKFKNGVSGTISQRGGINVMLAGTKGNITVHADGHYIEVFTPSLSSGSYFLNQSIKHIFPAESATVNAFKKMLRSITINDPLPISIQEIEGGTKMLLGCVWSHLNDGKLIKPAEMPSSISVSGHYNGSYA